MARESELKQRRIAKLGLWVVTLISILAIGGCFSPSNKMDTEDSNIDNLVLTAMEELIVTSSAEELNVITTVTSQSMPTENKVELETNLDILHITSQVKVGGDAHLSIQSSPGATCFLRYITPKGSVSGAEGLGESEADQDGVCEWKWNIGPNTEPGTGILRVTMGDGPQNIEIQIVE